MSLSSASSSKSPYVQNALLGRITLGLLAVLFSYYTLWVVGLPFVEADYLPLASALFPPVELALGVPAGLGTVVVLSLLARAYYLVCKDRRREKQQ